jgi:hypothetical protein
VIKIEVSLNFVIKIAPADEEMAAVSIQNKNWL